MNRVEKAPKITPLTWIDRSLPKVR